MSEQRRDDDPAMELRPGILTAAFTKIAADGSVIRTPIALADLADVIVRQARVNASNGQHEYGTPTPAQPGEGPARISGTLWGSLTRTDVKRTPFGAEVRVGTAPGKVPPYAKGKSRTPSSKYGYYLETGLRNGSKYPFLTTAFHFGVTVAAPSIYKKAYGNGWKRLL
jgi:hypothetical protein